MEDSLSNQLLEVSLACARGVDCVDLVELEQELDRRGFARRRDVADKVDFNRLSGRVDRLNAKLTYAPDPY